MKKIIYNFGLLILFILFFLNTSAQDISKAEAIILVQKFMSQIDKEFISKDILSINTKKKETTITYYVINFKNGGYVIVSANTEISPIISYSKSMTFDEQKVDSLTKKWLSGVEKYMAYKKKKAKSENVPTIKRILIPILDGLTIPALLEAEQSSRWAVWYPYSIEMPNQNANNACVPLAMAQIIKYHQYPIQGQGSYNGVDFSEQWYDYNNMAFRLTYCGNGEPNCNEGSFDILPEITESQMREVSRLIYHCGQTVNTTWGEGTYGTPGEWTHALETYFNYSSEWQYLNNTYIANNYETFKALLRNELLNKRPILFNFYPDIGSGHALLIDGVEYDNYFHFAMGQGGDNDAYYYLYNIDENNLYNISPQSGSYHATIGIKPKCTTNSNLVLSNITIDSNENIVYESKDYISISNFNIKGNTSSGARVAFQAGESITLGTNFEVELGAEVFMNILKCK